MVETITGLVLALVIAIALWNMRSIFFIQTDVWKEKVELSSKENKAELQEDYKDLWDTISSIKEKHSGKWYTMDDIDGLMK